MRAPLAVLAALIACAHPAAEVLAPKAQVGARRILEVTVLAHLGVGGRVAESLDASASIGPADGRHAARLAPGECAPIESPARSLAPVAELTLRYGLDTVLPYDLRAGRYRAAGVPLHRELAWQGLNLQAMGRDLKLDQNGAVQFPDVPVIDAAVPGPTGERYLWSGGDAATEVELRVESDDGAWRCGVDGAIIDVPAAMADLPGRHLRLVVGRTERHLAADGTLVVGQGAFVVPVVPADLRAEEPLPAVEGNHDRVGLPRSWWRHSGKTFRDQRPA